jgi:hypothetical protein
VLPQAVKRGMKVVLDMHEAPGCDFWTLQKRAA